MSHKNSLFGASFEQSRRIVDKGELLRYQNDFVTSLALSKKLLLFIPVFFWLGVTYALGVGLPHYCQAVEQVEGWQKIIASVGFYTSPMVEQLTLVILVLLVVNLLPKPNLAYQYLFSIVFSSLLAIDGLMALVPFSIGLALEAFGWLGFGLQLLACVYLWKVLVLAAFDDLKQQLYHDALPGKDWGVAIYTFLKTYGPILLGLSILNRWTFNVGELLKINPNILSFLYGWFFLFTVLLTCLGIRLSLKNIIAVLYFFKYRKEYRQHFKITDEQWYGKLRAKLKSMFIKKSL